MNKFYEFKNITPTSADLYLYGEIVEDNSELWSDESGVSLTDFKKDIDALVGITELNIYINSPGGSVFASSTMVSLLDRLKLKGTKIRTYIDGLCASASTFIFFSGDELNIYENSIAMVHKPMTMSIGNADDLQKDIDTLNKIEENIMLPLYERKAKIDRNEIKAMIDNETWLTAPEILEKFDVNLINQAKQVVASVSDKFKSVYKHIPKQLNEALTEQQKTAEEPKKIVHTVDYTTFENIIKKLKGEKQ